MGMSDSNTFDDATEYASLGADLRKIREAQGLTHEDVERATHMRPFIIRALEEGHIDTIGAPVYVRGFVKSYCEFLRADDIWKRYSVRLSILARQPETDIESGAYGDVAAPRPVFRRATFVWVYILLLVALAGVSYLLWSHHNSGSEDESGFYLQNAQTKISQDEQPQQAVPPIEETSQSQSKAGEALSADAVYGAESVDASADLSADAPLRAEAAGKTRSADLSWLDDTEHSQTPETPLDLLASSIPFDKLLIELTAPSGLVVRQDASVITRRKLLAIGSSRSYDVTSPTTVELTAGNAADITWNGRKYTSVGSGDMPLVLTFFPDGSVTLIEGESRHFGR